MAMMKKKETFIWMWNVRAGVKAGRYKDPGHHELCFARLPVYCENDNSNPSNYSFTINPRSSPRNTFLRRGFSGLIKTELVLPVESSKFTTL